MNDNINLTGKVIAVTGGRGWLGSKIVSKLLNQKAVVFNCPSSICNLISLDSTRRYFNLARPQYVIHCAGFNGGIIYNRQFPADIFFKNTQMALNVLEVCKEVNVQKVVSIMTSCSYPDNLDILCEKDLWKGQPHESIECHGLAKRNLESYSRFHYKQYGLKAHNAILTNLYGEGDTFSSRGKVVSMLIRKFVTAKQENLPYVDVLGTGKAFREFMYVEDAAAAVIKVLELYNDVSEPINIGTGEDISIYNLAHKIKDIVQSSGEIRWDESSGDGQIKKLLNVCKMKELLNFIPQTSLDKGLETTIEWYVQNKILACTRK